MSIMDSEAITKLHAKLDLYENCLAQLKKDVPIYFQKQAEIHQNTRKLSKALKILASSEGNQRLQNAIFFCCHTYERLEGKQQLIFESAAEELTQLIDESKTLVASPFKELLRDTTDGLKQPGITPRNKDHIESMLPINAQLFEEHRVKSIKQLLTRMLRSELHIHCRAIEDLSAALSEICALDSAPNNAGSVPPSDTVSIRSSTN